MTLAPAEIDDAQSYEALKMKNPENSSEHFKISNWFDQYLSRRITDPMAQYSSGDLSSDDGILNTIDILKTMNKKTENTSNESMKKRQGLSNNFENDESDHGLKKKDERYGIKNEAFDKFSRIKDLMRPDEWPILMLSPWEIEKATKQRREIRNEIDKARKVSK